MADNKVALATSDVTVHTLVDPTADPAKDFYGNDAYDVTTQVLLPGQSVPVDSLPPYLKKRLEAGEVEGLVVVSEKEAEKILADAEVLRAAVAGTVVPAPGQSHSDYLVPDSVRAAALRARAEAEGGGGDTDAFSAVEADANPAAHAVELSDEDTGENDSTKAAADAAEQADDPEKAVEASGQKASTKKSDK